MLLNFLFQGLKISFSQPNLRKAGQLNLKFPAKGYEEAQQEKFLIYSKVRTGSWSSNVFALKHIKYFQHIHIAYRIA